MNDYSDNTALAENKVLILYILNQIDSGIPEPGLFKIISSINNVNYFYFKQFLNDLIDLNLVCTFTKDEDSDEVILITSKGKNSLELTKEALPGIVKLKADSIFKEELSQIQEESSIIAEYTPRSENDYIVKCKIMEKNEPVFEIRTSAGSRERAKKIVDNWNNNAEQLYPKLLKILLSDTIDKKED